MSDDPTKLSDSDNSVLTTDCTCGGCGTGTACATDHTGIQMSNVGGVYAYAGPPVNDPFVWPNGPDLTGTDTITFTPGDDVKMRATLQNEVIKDLLTRVQKLEEKVESLQEENLDLRGSLDALVDIMDDEDDAPSVTWDGLINCISSQTADNGAARDLIAFLDQLVNTAHAKD